MLERFVEQGLTQGQLERCPDAAWQYDEYLSELGQAISVLEVQDRERLPISGTEKHRMS